MFSYTEILESVVELEVHFSCVITDLSLRVDYKILCNETPLFLAVEYVDLSYGKTVK